MSYKFTKKLFFLIYPLILFFFFVFPYYAKANNQALLAVPFNINVSPELNSLKENFMQELVNKLNQQGFNAKTTNVTSQNPTEVLTLIRNNNTQAAIYGNISQIATTLSIDAQYLYNNGTSSPIQLELSTSTDINTITTRIAQMATEAFNRIGNPPLAPVAEDELEEIRIKGNKILDTEIITSRMTIVRGDKVPTPKELNEEIRKIWNSGYYNDIEAEILEEDGKNILLITVEERPLIDEVLVEGSDAIKIKDIKEAIDSRSGHVLNERLLADDIQKILALYKQKAYYNAIVKHEIKNLANNKANLVFHVDEGNKLYIKNIVFDGIKGLKPKELENFLILKERGFFSFITGNGILKEEDLSRDAQTIAAYAVNEGYIQAKVGTPEVEYEKDGITITYKIDEGPRFALGEISFGGELIEDPEIFYDIVQIDEWKEKNKYFSLNTMQDDIRRLTLYYNDKGYAFAQIDIQDTVHQDSETIDIKFIMTPKERVYVNRVDVAGNYDTRDNVILRELRLADGDLFSGSKIERTQERLYKTDYFKKVDIKTEPTDNPAEVNLIIEVEENNTGTISAGVGYSTYDGVGVSASVSQNNLFGRGYKIGVEGYVSENEVNMKTYFWNPRVNDTNLGMGVSLYGIEQNWTYYDKDTLGGQLNFGYPLGEYTYLRWGYKYDTYTIYNVSDTVADSIADYIGDNWSSVFVTSVTRDTTNSNFFPTRGTKTRLAVEYGGDFLGGDDNFIKTTGEFGFYYALFPTFTFHARGVLGGVFKNTDKVIPAFERFYIGGIGTIRGYEYSEISPRDVDTDDTIGADRIFYSSVELPWLFEPDLGLALVPFFDFATSTDSLQHSFFENYYYSAGLELRWRSPMGDLRFAYGYPLKEDIEGNKRKSGRFEFSMGQAF